MSNEWDDLRIFLAVARAESLSGAGRALRLDPATIGRRIHRLEERSGALLFSKSAQGYALTDAGARMLAPIEQAEHSVATALSDVRGAGDLMQGQIRVGAPDGCANYLLPQVVTEICAMHPGLDVQIIALPRVFNLSKREADMAIAVSPPVAGRLTVQKITDYRLSLAASNTYLATCAPLGRLSDLENHRIVGYIPDMIFDSELDYLSELGNPRVALASNSVSVQVNLIRSGAGVGIFHDFALPFVPDVRRVLEDKVALTRSFYLIRHASDTRMKHLNRFAKLLNEGLRRAVFNLQSSVA